ncbi:MAG: oligosaccharide flippase family protein [Fusobacterium sp.]
MARNELKIGSVLSIATLILGSLVQIIYTPMYMKYLGTSDYGIMSLARSLVNYVGILNMGIGSAILRYTVRYRTEGKIEEEKALNGMFIIIFIVISIIASFVLMYLYARIPHFFKESFTNTELIKTKQAFLVMGINLVISFPLSVFSANIISREKFLYQRGLRLVTTLLNPIIGAILMINGFGLIPVVISMALITFCTYFFDLFYAIKLGMGINFKNINWSVSKEIFAYSFFIFLNMIIDKINWEVDNVIIGKYIGTVAVGLYSLSRIINQVYMGFSGSISGVLFPRINKLLVEKKYGEINNMFLKAGRIQYVLLGLISSGFLLLGKDFIYLWLGEGYGVVYKVVVLVMIPLTISLIQNTGISIMQAMNKHQFRSVVYGIIAILNIFISIILVKNYGILGCAFGTSLSFVVGNIVIMNIYYHKVIKIDMILFWKNIFQMTIPILIALLFGYFLNKYFRNINLLNFLIKGSLYSLVYMILMWKISLNEYEKKQLLNPVFKVYNKLKR